MEYKNLTGKIEEQKSEIRWFFACIFLLLSVTVIQSASLIKLLERTPELYFTSQILNKNEFYIYKQDPRSLLIKENK